MYVSTHHARTVARTIARTVACTSQDIAAKEASGEMEKQKTVPVFKDMVKPGVLDGIKKQMGI